MSPSAGAPDVARRVLLAAAGAPWESGLVQALGSAPEVVLVRRCVDVAELVALAHAGGADAAVVDLSLPGVDVEAVATLERLGVAVLGVGDAERGDALGVRATGAPSDVVGLLAAAPASGGRAVEPPGPSRGRGLLVVVWGPVGAPGRSTVALGLADAVAAAGPSTVLVDADVRGGAQAQMLGLLDEVSGLLAACRAANRGDADGVDEHLQRVRGGPAVLTGVPRPDMAVHVRRAALLRVVEHLLGRHDVVVLDVGPEAGAGESGPDPAAALLAAADVVVAVGRADPVGLTRLVRGLHVLREEGVASPVVVLNRVRRSMGWDHRELRGTVERLAGLRPAALLPDDAVVDTAVLRGRTPREVDAGAAWVVAVDALSAHVVPAVTSPRR